MKGKSSCPRICAQIHLWNARWTPGRTARPARSPYRQLQVFLLNNSDFGVSEIPSQMSRLGGRLSLSPESSGPSPVLVGVPPPAYKSGIHLQQRERNFKKSHHDYVNDDYFLHTGPLAKAKGQSVIRSGLVSKRSAAFEEFVKGTHPVTQAGSHGGMIPTLPSHNGISKSLFQLVANGPASGSHSGSAFHQLKQQQQQTPIISNYENYTPKSMSPYTQLAFKQVNNGYESVQVLAANQSASTTPTTLGSSYKSTIENKVKLLSQQQQKDPTYASNMHVRVPSQDSSIYSDTRTYINEVRPVAIASRRGGIFRNPSKTQLQPRGQGQGSRSTAATQPAIPRSQVVQKVMEPSYSSLLQNQGEQNQAIYANFDFRSTSDSTEDEYTSPPSPVSSSYSELRAATRIPMGMPNMTSMNPSAMFYDSFYEPISDGKQNGNHNVIHQQHHKPNFGLGGLGSHYDDNFGPCSKCLELIVGEGKGCSAMGRLYHIKCFTCHQCHCLLQGKPFYALDGKVNY